MVYRVYWSDVLLLQTFLSEVVVPFKRFLSDIQPLLAFVKPYRHLIPAVLVINLVAHFSHIFVFCAILVFSERLLQPIALQGFNTHLGISISLPFPLLV